MTITDTRVPCEHTGISSWSLMASSINSIFFFITVYVHNGLVRRRVTLISLQNVPGAKSELGSSSSKRQNLPSFRPSSISDSNCWRSYQLATALKVNIVHSFKDFSLSLDTILDGISCVCARCTYRPGIGTLHWYLDRSGNQS